MKAYAANLTTSSVLMAAPLWITALQQVNVVLGTASAIIGIIVGGHALYKIFTGRHR